MLGKGIVPRIQSHVGSPAVLTALSVTWASVSCFLKGVSSSSWGDPGLQGPVKGNSGDLPRPNPHPLHPTHTHPHRQGEPGVSALHPEEHFHCVPGRTHASGLRRHVPQPSGGPDAARGRQQAQQRQPLVRQDTAGEELAGPELPPTHTQAQPTATSGLPVPPLDSGVPGFPACKARGNQQVDAAVISSSQPVFPKPGPVTPVTSNTSIRDQGEPGMWGQAERHSLGHDFPCCEMG